MALNIYDEIVKQGRGRITTADRIELADGKTVEQVINELLANQLKVVFVTTEDYETGNWSAADGALVVVYDPDDEPRDLQTVEPEVPLDEN